MGKAAMTTTTAHREPHASAFEAPCGSYYDSAAEGIASNFGTFDLTPAESPDRAALLAKAQRETDRELRDFFFGVLMSRWTRAALLLLATAGALALTGCGGGGDDEEPGTFTPAVVESEYVRCDNGRTAYSIEECRTMPALPKAVQP